MVTMAHNSALWDAIALWMLVVGLGACFGSFSNVLIYRLPRNLGVCRGRSHCPSCDALIAWYDNIPIISWLVLRARCRRCGTSISARYPGVELGGVLCAVVAYLRFGGTLEGLSAFFFLLTLLNIALIDWEHMIIPHTLTVGGALLGLVFSFLGGLPPFSALLGAAVGGGIILAVSWGYKLVRGVVGMGGGDVMLMGMVGVYLGPLGVLAVLFGGSLLGAVYAVAAGGGQVQGDAKLPFGTFLALSAAIVLLFGARLFSLYMARF